VAAKNKSVRAVRPKANNIWQVGPRYDIFMRTLRPKADNIWQVRPDYDIWYQSPTYWLFDGVDGVVGLLKGVACNIPYRWVRTWGKALYEHAHLD
jgi:hypothetical protein